MGHDTEYERVYDFGLQLTPSDEDNKKLDELVANYRNAKTELIEFIRDVRLDAKKLFYRNCDDAYPGRPI